MHLLTVPGIHNSGPGHWQTLWEQVPGRVARRFAPSSWDEPEAWDWVAAVERDLADLGPDTVVVAHSMGALAAAHVAATAGGFRGVVLVAPPDVDGPNFPTDALRFGELKPAPLLVPGLLLTSRDDHYGEPEAYARLAAAWDVPHLQLGALGHINAESGLGSWDQGWQLVTAFVAGTGPAGDRSAAQ
jgi:predicted alpha/beta hydrolase family esterase